MKRGISAVVATVLIILITIAAVTIIWTAVIPMIQKETSFGQELVELTIETAGGYSVYDSSTGNTTVQVSRGSDEENLVGIQFIFSRAGNSISYTSYDVPDNNHMKTYKFDLSSFGEPDSISIAGVFGNNQTGSVTSEITSLPNGNLSNVGGTFIKPSNQTATCTDSDGGLNYTVSGFVNSSMGGWAQDYCSNSTTLQERYCDSMKNLSTSSYACLCTNGACNVPAIDIDNDGYNSTIDCNDTNSSIHPNAIEVCNYVDDDCDSLIDEGNVCVPSDPILWLRFEGNTMDETRIHANGTLQGTAQLRNDASPKRSGVVNVEGLYPGGPYGDVRIDNVQHLEIGTWGAWVNPDSASPNWNRIMFKLSYVELFLKAGKAGGEVVNSSGFRKDTVSPNNVPLNSWTHIMASYNGNILRLYVNGTEVSNTSVGGTLTNNTGDLGIGASPGSNTWAFNGSIDDVMIFNRTLSSSEILSIYNYQAD